MYDADGAGLGAAVVTKFAMDGWNPALKGSIGNSKWNVLADLDSGGSLKTRYLRGDVVDQLFAEMAYSSGTHTTNWTLTDIRGSVRDVVDNSAYVKDSINYGAFGNIFTTGALAETSHTDRGRYAWSGRELDIETGLQYNRARYYDSNTGRWLSQDPLGFNAGDSNLYRYAKNRPTVATDPSGFISVSLMPLQNVITNYPEMNAAKDKKFNWTAQPSGKDVLVEGVKTKVDGLDSYAVRYYLGIRFWSPANLIERGLGRKYDLIQKIAQVQTEQI